MRKMTAIFAALVVLLVMAVPASATTHRMPFSGEDHLTAGPYGGRTWVSNGIVHVRGSMSEYEATSDSEFYVGDASVVVNYNLNPETMRGFMWGTNHIDVDEYNGGFDGRWVAWFTDTGWEGRGHSHGYGELAGYRQWYHLEGAPFGDIIEGFTFVRGHRH